MGWKVMISAPYMQPVPEKCCRIMEENGIELIVPPVNESMSEDELLKYIKDIDGVISGDDNFTDRVLKAAPKLKVISKWGTGIDSIDLEAAKKYGIVVRNIPNAFIGPVADSVLGYILCFARKIREMQEEMRAGKWEKIQGLSLSESTLGVVGVGKIGKAVIKRALSFGMKIIGSDIKEVPKTFIDETGLQILSKDELLGKADFVSINCDLNATSYHIIDERELKLMKSTAYIINTARGPLINEEYLIKALQNNNIAGAALDVFEEEPLSANSMLRKLDNVMLAPHNSNSSPYAREKVHEGSVNNLIEELEKSNK